MEPVDRVHRPLGKMLLHNFLGGIAWALGVTVGLSIVLGILGYLVSKVDFVPVIGDFVKKITESVIEQPKPEIRIPSKAAAPTLIPTQQIPEE
ncbi:MAG: hypothetical protein HYU80_03330 [Candidatus Blackburnbacteria bacterium]|nr:hypothetical protein [Candidatus Blackburnbacteria bacterium]